MFTSLLEKTVLELVYTLKTNKSSCFLSYVVYVKMKNKKHNISLSNYGGLVVSLRENVGRKQI